MKKITLFLFCILSILSCVETKAQSVDFTQDGRHYYIASPDGRYFTGTVEEGPACLFDAETKIHYVSEEDSVLIYAITNDGIACGALMGQPAVWVRGQEWKTLPPVSLKGKQPIGGEVNGLSSDATKFIAMVKYQNGNNVDIRAIYYELDKFENWDNEDSWKVKSLPIPTKADLLYNQAPQFVQICGMNYDGTRILGRYMLADGKRQVPFIWQKGENDEWAINFVAERCLFVEDFVNGVLDPLPDREGLAGNDIIDYDILRESLENGIIYDLSPYSLFAWTGSGRYIPVSANVASAENPMGTYYAAVIDVDKDTLVVFKAIPDAGSISVNDKGEVMVYTPQMNTFRDSYVISIDNPTAPISLIEYTKQRTNGVIDLAQYMTYRRGGTDEKPEMVTAAGSAIWANDGNAFVTFNYDEWNEMKIPHCYMVRFGAAVDVEKIEVEQLVVYPNPTSGIVNFAEQLENVEIFDIAGRKVYSQSIAEQSMNLSILNEGTYILIAQSAGKNIMTKLVIVR